MLTEKKLKRLSLGLTTDTKYYNDLYDAWRYALMDYTPIEYGKRTYQVAETDRFTGGYLGSYEALFPKNLCLSDDIVKWINGYNDEVYSHTYRAAIENGLEEYVTNIVEKNQSLEEAVGDPEAKDKIW